MSVERASGFATQADALLRKSLTFQKRRSRTNLSLILSPILVCLFISICQKAVDNLMNQISATCGCRCITPKPTPDGECDKKECGFEFSTPSSVLNCDIPKPPMWPPLLQVPLPDESCKNINGSCPIHVLLTGASQSFGEKLAKNFFSSGPVDTNSSNALGTLANLYVGTDTEPAINHYLEPCFEQKGVNQIYNIQQECSPNSTFTVPIQLGSITIQEEVTCLQSIQEWRKSSSVMNEEILKGKAKDDVHDIASAYDFLNSNENNFNVSIWYDPTGNRNSKATMTVVRVPRLVSVVSNAYLQLLKGAGVKIQFDFVKEMPRHSGKEKRQDMFAALSPLLFSWVVMQLIPEIGAFLELEFWGSMHSIAGIASELALVVIFIMEHQLPIRSTVGA